MTRYLDTSSYKPINDKIECTRYASAELILQEMSSPSIKKIHVNAAQMKGKEELDKRPVGL